MLVVSELQVVVHQQREVPVVQLHLLGIKRGVFLVGWVELVVVMVAQVEVITEVPEEAQVLQVELETLVLWNLLR